MSVGCSLWAAARTNCGPLDAGTVAPHLPEGRARPRLDLTRPLREGGPVETVFQVAPVVEVSGAECPGLFARCLARLALAALALLAAVVVPCALHAKACCGPRTTKSTLSGKISAALCAFVGDFGRAGS